VHLGLFPAVASLLTTAQGSCAMAMCHNAWPWLGARHDIDIVTMVTTTAHDHDENCDTTTGDWPNAVTRSKWGHAAGS
jgi:hypothetical protein